jgi:hypothetical protein
MSIVAPTCWVDYLRNGTIERSDGLSFTVREIKLMTIGCDAVLGSIIHARFIS